jgi:hypothetical protein
VTPITFLDTSVLCELLKVPGKCQRAEEVEAEFRQRIKDGERFIIPVTAVIETGNHIAQASGDRRAAAERFDHWLRMSVAGDAPFHVNLVAWDDDFLIKLCDGDAASQSLTDLAGSGQLGAGDVAILVERDRFVARSAYNRTHVRIWTLENTLAAYA